MYPLHTELKQLFKENTSVKNWWILHLHLEIIYGISYLAMLGLLMSIYSHHCLHLRID